MTPSDLARLMADIIDVDDIAADEGFFDVGGNSFDALKLINDIQLASGATVSLLDVVQHSTPEGLSDLIRKRSADCTRHTLNGASNQ